MGTMRWDRAGQDRRANTQGRERVKERRYMPAWSKGRKSLAERVYANAEFPLFVAACQTWLDALPHTAERSTADLGKAVADATGIEPRRVFHLLGVATDCNLEEFRGYWHKGEPVTKQQYGRTITARPRVWHAMRSTGK